MNSHHHDSGPHMSFTASQWGRLRANTPLALTEDDLEKLRGLNVELSLEEVTKIYLPLSRLLNLYVGASQELYRATDTFLGKLPAKVPFVIGVGGSVAVGKSTTARVLQTILARWPNHPKVDLITTDGFLYPNAVLKDRGLMDRKGFPESYNRKGLIDFLDEVKSGKAEASAPVYSHLVYDIVDGAEVVVTQPDILIVEGLTVLQAAPVDADRQIFVSDYFDFSIFVDADVADIRKWYVERFFTLRETAFRDPQSFFRRYASLDDAQARETAIDIWTRINERNLYENVLPTRGRADLILHKGEDHAVTEVKLRRL